LNINTNYSNTHNANISKNASLPAGMKPLTGEFFEEFLRNRREVMESLGYGDKLNTGFRLLGADGASVISPFHEFRSQFASLPQRVLPQETIDNLNNAGNEPIVSQNTPWLDFPITAESPWTQFNPMSPSDVGAADQAIWLQRAILKYPGLSEMSDIEAYKFIEAQFLAVFGDDFMTGWNLNLGADNWLGVEGEWLRVGRNFQSAIVAHFGHPNTANAVNRKRLFGDKSDAEIKQTIMDRYPRNISNRELAMMHGEMLAVGLLDSPLGWIPTNKAGVCATWLIDIYSREFGSAWADMLDEPVDWNKLFSRYNEWSQTGIHVFSPKLTDLLKDLATNFAN